MCPSGWRPLKYLSIFLQKEEVRRLSDCRCYASFEFCSFQGVESTRSALKAV